MNTPTKVITWQPVLTDHQAFTYEELSRQAHMPVIAYVTKMEDETRRAQGWTDTQVSSIERRLIPNHGMLRYCFQEMRTYRNEIHFFGSPFEQPRLMLCLVMALWLGIEFYLISEPYSPITQGYFSDGVGLLNRIKSWTRPLVYRTYILALRRRLAGIFAISPLALRQFRAAGMPREKLFPFGYFVPRVGHPLAVPNNDASLRIVFVGSLIARKGVDILIDAICRANKLGCEIYLDIFGPGELKDPHVRLPQINIRGALPFGKAQDVMAAYDLLVLPSRYDGWGVVVNEALCAGVPVICSDSVGAKTVVDAFGAGVIFESGNAEMLCEIVMGVARSRDRLRVMRRGTVSAGDALQPSVAAKYMLDIMRSSNGHKNDVLSPWYK